MTEIELQFTEFFQGETVIVSIDGREIAREARLKTDMRTGLARIARLKAPAEALNLTLAIPSGSSVTVAVQPAQVKHVRIACANGTLKAEVCTHDSYRREPRGFA